METTKVETTNLDTRLPPPAANGHPQIEPPANPPRRTRTRTILVIAAVVVALFAVFLGLGIIYRSRQSHDLASAVALCVGAP